MFSYREIVQYENNNSNIYDYVLQLLSVSWNIKTCNPMEGQIRQGEHNLGQENWASATCISLLTITSICQFNITGQSNTIGQSNITKGQSNTTEDQSNTIEDQSNITEGQSKISQCNIIRGQSNILRCQSNNLNMTEDWSSITKDKSSIRESQFNVTRQFNIYHRASPISQMESLKWKTANPITKVSPILPRDNQISCTSIPILKQRVSPV